MTPERWRQVVSIVSEALEIDPAERAAFLERSCAGDADLVEEARSLLIAEDSGFLEPDRPPQRIGVYCVSREIGRGGIGAVYQGDRDDGLFEQRVAIKLVKRGMDTRAVLRRFFAERQILARLQHPNIARLLDGGMSADGRPYFVMEYLDAEPIVSYCERRNLSRDARLRLFTIVCDAVEHAHSQLILHRDIKPGNILVDSNGIPKLLDFGIAKLLAGASSHASGVRSAADDQALQTEPGMRVMTPQYASPEQMQGEPLSTSSDVYALGLLLYELLTGSFPYEVPASPPAAQIQAVCERLPAPAREIHGDLGKVVLKALEKDPARRYQRAADLAEDLRRFLENRPVLARPAGVWYRARKFASRNWRSLAVAAIVVAILAVAIGDAIIQGRRAQRRFQDVRRLSNSFLFEFYDAIAKLPGATPARELVVKRAQEYLDILVKESAGDPDLKMELAEAYVRLGQAQGAIHEANLGKTEEARMSLEKARSLWLEVARARPSDSRAKTELARINLGLASPLQTKDPARGASLRQETIDLLKQASAAGPLDARARLTLAQAYFGNAEADGIAGKLKEALAARNQSIDILRELAATNPTFEEGPRWLSTSLKRRAAFYLAQQPDMAQAQQDLDEAIAIDERRVNADPTNGIAKMDLALGRGYLSALLRRKGDLDGALTMLDRAMSARVEALLADPRNMRARVLLVSDYSKLASMKREQKNLAESAAALRKGFDLASAGGPPAASNQDIADSVAGLHMQAALNAAGTGNCREASRSWGQVHDLRPRMSPDPALAKCGIQ